MKEKIILHSDANNFFASCECATKPELKNKPVAVAGNPEKRTGIILAKNNLAKAKGVKTGEAIWIAQKKCPDLVCVAPHYQLYETVSKQLHEIYLQYTDQVEPMGMDECWLDVTNSVKYLGMNGEEIANDIRQKVKDKLGITVSVGVSFSKLFAKLGSDLKKPDATTILSKQNFKQKTYHLPINDIVGIGKQLNLKLEKINVATVGDFVNLDTNYIAKNFGKVGIELQQKLKGEFDEPVACYFDLAPPKSIGNGTTTITDIIAREDISKVVAFLCEKVADRMTETSYQGSCITVSVKTNNFKVFQHSRTVLPMRSYEEIFSQAMKLLDSFWQYNQHIRSIRVNISTLEKIDKQEQLTFFTMQPDNLSKTLNFVKNKYGSDKIFVASDKASFINRKSDDEPAPH